MPFHFAGSPEYHDDEGCALSQQVPLRSRIEGTGDKRRCLDCHQIAVLRSESERQQAKDG